MNRLGLSYPSELEGDAKALYNAFDEYTTNKYGIIPGVSSKLKDGRFVGPFGALLHTPGPGQHFLGLAKTIAKIPGLSGRNREIAILTVGGRFKAAFELHAHKILGARQGVTSEEYDELERGNMPESFDEEGKAVYDVAYELAYGSGPLSQGTWDQAVKLLTKDGATALVQYVAFYSYVCTILRGFDCKIPDKDE